MLNSKFIYLKTTDISDAYILFETINARGADLSVKDLIKSKILATIKNQNKNKELANKWAELDSEVSKKNGSFEKLLRFYWNSIGEFSSTSQLYNHYRSSTIFNNETSVLNFCNNLESSVKVYCAICDPNVLTMGDITKNHNDWKFDNPESYKKNKSTADALKRSFEALKQQGIILFTPIILSTYRWLTVESLLKMSITVESIAYRNILVCNHASNLYEKDTSNWALDLHNKNGDNFETILSNFNNEICTTSELSNQFKIWNTDTDKEDSAKSKLIRYILEELFDEPIQDREGLELEHINPQTPNEKSPKDSDIILNIGNLAVLEKPLNGQCKNKPFTEKLKIYRKSKTKCMNELCKLYDETISKDEKFPYPDDIWTELCMEYWRNILLEKFKIRWPKPDESAPPKKNGRQATLI